MALPLTEILAMRYLFSSMLLLAFSFSISAQQLKGKFSTQKQNIGSGVIAWKTIEFFGDGTAIWEWHRDYRNSQTESNGGEEWTILGLLASPVENGKITLSCESKEELRSDQEEPKVRSCFPNNILAEITENGLFVRNGDNDGLYSGIIPFEIKEKLKTGSTAEGNISSTRSGNSSPNNTLGGTLAAINDKPENLFEGLLKEFDPEGYADISYMKSMQAQGERIVNGLVQKVNQYGNLIETNDPASLLQDFQSKFSSLENIQANYQKQSFDFGYQRGQQLSGQLSNSDYEGAFINSISFLNTLGEMRRAEKELEARKKALEQQKQNQMFQIYKMAWEKNNELLEVYNERAAYAESIKDEQNNLQYVYHQVCYLNSMTNGINANRDDWYLDRCSVPSISNETEMVNKLVSKDIRLMQIADRKMKFYEEGSGEVYLEAAISFTAKAVKENPSAENYLKLAELYAKSSNILALVALESAKAVDASLFFAETLKFYNETRNAAIDEVTNAIINNDIDYLQSFVNVGLHKTVRLDGKPLLSFTISLDKPDAVQTLLNYEADRLDQEQLQEKINETLILAAFLNASNTIARIKNLGVNIDFEKNGKNLVDYAVEGLSPNAIQELLKLNSYRKHYQDKYGNHPIDLMVTGIVNPTLAAEKAKGISVEDTGILVSRLIQLANKNAEYYTLFSLSPAFQKHIKGDTHLLEEITMSFKEQMTLPSPLSKAHLILRTGLVNINEIKVSDEKSNRLEKRTTGPGIYSEDYDPLIIKNLKVDYYHNHLMQLAENGSSQLNSTNDFVSENNALKGYPENTAFKLYKSFVETIPYENEHLAFTSYVFANTDLFKEIDSKEDLSAVTVSNGQSLLDYMKRSLDESGLGHAFYRNKEFISPDFFDLTKEKGRQELYDLILSVNTLKKEAKWIQNLPKSVNSDEEILNRLKNQAGFKSYRERLIQYIFENQEIDINAKLTDDGGTILHWLINSNLKQDLDEETLDHRVVSAFLALGVDMNVKDNNGKTVSDLISNNKKELKRLKAFSFGFDFENAYEYYEAILDL